MIGQFILFCFLVFILFFFSLSILNVKINKIVVSFILFFLVILLGILCITTYPSEGGDLSRYYKELSLYQLKGSLYLSQSSYSFFPITNFYFYLIALSGQNYLLQFGSFIVIVLSLFIYFKKINKIIEIDSNSIIVYYTLILFFISIMAVLLSVRSVVCYSLILTLSTIDITMSKKNKLFNILYIFPVLIHAEALIFVMTIFFFKIFKEVNLKNIIIIIVIALSANFFINKISNIDIDYIQYLIKKFDVYNKNDFIDNRFFIIKIVFSMLLAFLCFTCLKEKNINSFERKLISLEILFFILGISFSFNKTICVRNLEMFILFSFPTLNIFFRKFKNKFLLFKFLFYGVFVLIIVYQIIAMKNQWEFVV